jgi:hypothetical protein
LPIFDFYNNRVFLLGISKNGMLNPSIKTDDPKFQQYLVPEKIKKFLSAAMADYIKFREVQKKEPTRPGYEQLSLTTF